MATFLYWDTSAILSLLVSDDHSAVARHVAAIPAVHLVSTLGYAETASVLSRQADALTSVGIDPHERLQAARAFFRLSPAAPGANEIEAAAAARLKGADTWHLAFQMTAERDLHGLCTVSFDRALVRALRARGTLFSPTSGRK